MTCKDTEKVYIGNTSQTFKKRMDQHYQDTIQKVINKNSTDTFADHFAKSFENSPFKPKPADICKKISCKILWQGNPLSMAKSFRKSVCKLCMQERSLILNYHRKVLEPY